MKLDEIMIGDWVGHPTKGRGRVTAIQDNGVVFLDVCEDIDGACEIGELEPVPIDAEILADTGFEVTNESHGLQTWHLDSVGWVYRFDGGEWEFELIGYGAKNGGRGKYRGVLENAHQLQHALRLVGVVREVAVRR